VDGIIGCVNVKILLDGVSDPDAISETYAADFGYRFRKLNSKVPQEHTVSLVGANGCIQYNKVIYLPVKYNG
jgi:hypothetical protein